MVRLLMCHNFKQQRVFSDAFEPASVAASLPLNVVFVATNDRRVFVYSLSEDGFPLVCHFPLVSNAKQLLYNNYGNCLVTRETTRKDRPRQYTARVYFNWSHWDGSKTRKLQQFHVGFSLGYNFSLEPNDLISVEISTRFSVRALACCTVNGTIATATETMIAVYKACQNCPMDFDKMYHLEAGFSIYKLAICEQFIAFASTNEVRVLKITTSIKSGDKDDKKDDMMCSEPVEVLASNGILSNNMSQREVIEEDFVVWPFDHNTHHCVETPCWDGGEHTISTIVELPSIISEVPYTDYAEEGYEIYGPTKAVHGHPLIFHSGDEALHHVTMLYKSLEVDLLRQEGESVEIHSLQLVPFYASNGSGGEECSSTTPQLSGTICFLSTAKQGFVYNVFSKAEKICECSYTSDTTLAYIGDNMLYTVTKHSIEVYTVPYYATFAAEARASGPQDQRDSILVPGDSCDDELSPGQSSDDSLLSNTNHGCVETVQKHAVSGFPVHNLDILRKPCPPARKDLFVIGVHLFPGVYYITSFGTKILLLSDDSIKSPSKRHRRKAKSAGVENPFKEWTLHILEAMDLNTLYDKMESLTEAAGDGFSGHADLRLLEEQHLLLRWQLQIANTACCSTTRNMLLENLKKSVRKLGDYYARYAEDGVEDVLSYYKMAGVSLDEIISEHVPEAIDIEKLEDKPYGAGLICYLNNIFFTKNPEKRAMSFPKVIADKIIYVYSNTEPSQLSELILRPMITGYCPELVANILVKLKKAKRYKFTVEDHLSLAVMYLQLCAIEHAAGELITLSQESLSEVCVKRHYMFFEKDESVSPLAQLLRQRLPKVFIKTLVSLHLRGIVTLKRAVELLQKKDNADHWNAHLSEFLELVLNDQKGKNSFKEARELLVDIYFGQLSDQKTSLDRDLTRLPHYHIPRGSGHFAKRLPWLDKLPPFNGLVAEPKDCPYVKKAILSSSSSHGNVQLLGVSPNRSPKLVETGARISCNCCCCWETLLKLQSILCCRYRDESIGRYVLEKLSTIPSDMEASCISIYLLSFPLVQESQKAVDLLLRVQPIILMNYGKHYFGNSSEKWRCALDVLTDKLRQSECPEHKEELYQKLIKETLSILAQYTPRSQLLSILPDDGNFMFFLPYLIQNCKKHRAQGLANHITAS